MSGTKVIIAIELPADVMEPPRATFDGQEPSNTSLRFFFRYGLKVIQDWLRLALMEKLLDFTHPYVKPNGRRKLFPIEDRRRFEQLHTSTANFKVTCKWTESNFSIILDQLKRYKR